MKILLANSAAGPAYALFDNLVERTLLQMGHDVLVFDLQSHLSFFQAAFRLMEEAKGIDADPDWICHYGASPLLVEIGRYKPHILLALHGGLLPADVVSAVRHMNIKTALWIVGRCVFEVGSAIKAAPAYDSVFCADEALPPLLRELECNRACHLPFGVYPLYFDSGAAAPGYHSSDICLIGAASRRFADILEAVSNQFTEPGLVIKAVGQGLSPGFAGGRFAALIPDNPGDPFVIRRHLSGARIVVNAAEPDQGRFTIKGKKRTIVFRSPDHSVFDAAAHGTAQLVSDRLTGLPRYFRVGEELDTYGNIDDLLRKVEFYSREDDKRQGMAESSRARCLSEHTLELRLKDMLENIGS